MERIRRKVKVGRRIAKTKTRKSRNNSKKRRWIFKIWISKVNTGRKFWSGRERKIRERTWEISFNNVNLRKGIRS